MCIKDTLEKERVGGLGCKNDQYKQMDLLTDICKYIFSSSFTMTAGVTHGNVLTAGHCLAVRWVHKGVAGIVGVFTVVELVLC